MFNNMNAIFSDKIIQTVQWTRLNNLFLLILGENGLKTMANVIPEKGTFFNQNSLVLPKIAKNYFVVQKPCQNGGPNHYKYRVSYWKLFFRLLETKHT